MATDPEARALMEAAASLVSDRLLVADVEMVSARGVAAEWAVVHEALVLQIAAVMRLGAQPKQDDRQKAVLGLAGLQREILAGAWDNMLRGRYAAAIQPSRLLYELPVFIMAGSVSLEQAGQFLGRSDWQWNFNDAYQEVTRAADDRGALAEFKAWYEGRQEHRKALHQFAHPSGGLTLQALRFHGRAFGVPHGLSPDQTMLQRTAPHFVVVAEGMVYAIEWALHNVLEANGSWRHRRRAFTAFNTDYEERWQQSQAVRRPAASRRRR